MVSNWKILLALYLMIGLGVSIGMSAQKGSVGYGIDEAVIVAIWPVAVSARLTYRYLKP